MNARAQLESVYGDQRNDDGKLIAAKDPPAPPGLLQQRKDAVFAALRNDYAKLKEQWNGDGRYDAWFARELNNARLNTIANYYDYLPGFEALLKLKEGNLDAFYRAVERLAEMPRDERHEWLRTLGQQPLRNPDTSLSTAIHHLDHTD